MRLKTASCFEALLQIWDTWSLKRNVKSIFIPKRVALSSNLISAESILKEVISSCVREGWSNVLSMLLLYKL